MSNRPVLGDCLTYGMAVERGAPVVCVGEDLASTDVEVLPTGQGHDRRPRRGIGPVPPAV